MRIKVIGSGSMWNEYNSASYMIDNDILVDMPNGMCKNLFRMGINPIDINHVVITHFHGDHFFDLPFYMLLKVKKNDDSINIYCTENGNNKILSIMKLAFESAYGNAEDITKFENNASFKIGKYNINRIVVDHGNIDAYGYIFDNGKNKVGFTGDTTYCDNILNMASVCDYLFCDCMFMESTDKHMGVNDLKELLVKCPNCKFIVSHLENETRKELLEMNLTNVVVPEDGLVIEI